MVNRSVSWALACCLRAVLVIARHCYICSGAETPSSPSPLARTIRTASVKAIRALEVPRHRQEFVFVVVLVKCARQVAYVVGDQVRRCILSSRLDDFWISAQHQHEVSFVTPQAALDPFRSLEARLPRSWARARCYKPERAHTGRRTDCLSWTSQAPGRVQMLVVLAHRIEKSCGVFAHLFTKLRSHELPGARRHRHFFFATNRLQTAQSSSSRSESSPAAASAPFTVEYNRDGPRPRH